MKRFSFGHTYNPEGCPGSRHTKKLTLYNLFSCEEAALEVQKSVCLSVCPSVEKLNFAFRERTLERD